MPYTKSLSRLNNITDMKIAKTMSELDELRSQIRELENKKQHLFEELEKCKSLMEHLINEKVSNMSEYYKTRSNISLQGTKIVMLEAQIENIDDEIEELSEGLGKFHEEILKLKRKKKKYDRILQEGK